MKTNILIHTVALCFILFEGSAKAKTLTEILGQYCVPGNASNCTGDTRATYNTARNICECNSLERYYNVGNRDCETCITGSYASSDYKTCEPIKCPAGYEPVLVTNGNCPSGYALQAVTNNNCPGGSTLKSYSVTSKTWN